ncbi:hypothetical protein H4R99_005086 [Coemansia sp. RSA 1722]|nr:hypothetical protein LPJ57_002341 [Coemansia sp. RSA 486]KAJ2237278.1 hypothetical protein IWW45_001095 [Coemansia sp. RSA 485]KAJ2596050.1 hypothetical protein H4R99_005086 [Coemansia sp. RSA 1722]
MSDREINVVIVGTSIAGMTAAKAVAALSKQGYPNLRVTTIDKNEYYYHAIGAPRAVVDKEFGKQLLLPVKNLLQSFELDPESPKHRFIHASVVSVNKHSVVLSDGQIIVYDYLVLATGARNKLPAHIQGPTFADAKQQMARVYDNVSKAKNILIVGGGPVGVEIAGEIAYAYKDKSVTLVHGAERLLPPNFKPGLSNGAVHKLERLGVKVVLNEKIDIPKDVLFDCSVRPLSLVGSSGASYSSDLQILTTGITFESDYLHGLETDLKVSLRQPNGSIKVKSTLQLDCDALPNVFVPGDVNSLPAGAKYAVKAKEQATSVGNNLVLMIKQGYDEDNKKMPALLDYTGGEMNMTLVPIGKELGVFQALGIAFGKSFVGDFLSKMKSKDYFLSKFASEF